MTGDSERTKRRIRIPQLSTLSWIEVFIYGFTALITGFLAIFTLSVVRPLDLAIIGSLLPGYLCWAGTRLTFSILSKGSQPGICKDAALRSDMLYFCGFLGIVLSLAYTFFVFSSANSFRDYSSGLLLCGFFFLISLLLCWRSKKNPRGNRPMQEQNPTSREEQS
jgi:hypothetical protein